MVVIGALCSGAGVGTLLGAALGGSVGAGSMTVMGIVIGVGKLDDTAIGLYYGFVGTVGDMASTGSDHRGSVTLDGFGTRDSTALGALNVCFMTMDNKASIGSDMGSGTTLRDSDVSGKIITGDRTSTEAAVDWTTIGRTYGYIVTVDGDRTLTGSVMGI
jgi:hypothetical protein